MHLPPPRLAPNGLRSHHTQWSAPEARAQRKSPQGVNRAGFFFGRIGAQGSSQLELSTHRHLRPGMPRFLCVFAQSIWRTIPENQDLYNPFFMSSAATCTAAAAGVEWSADSKIKPSRFTVQRQAPSRQTESTSQPARPIARSTCRPLVGLCAGLICWASNS